MGIDEPKFLLCFLITSTCISFLLEDTENPYYSDKHFLEYVLSTIIYSFPVSIVLLVIVNSLGF